MSDVIIIPDERVDYLIGGGVVMDAVYLERLAGELDKPVLRQIAKDLEMIWWWARHPESAVIAGVIK